MQTVEDPAGMSALDGHELAPEIAVRLAGVSKRFGDVTAVDGVTIDVPAGSFVTLLGPSGCGKTTLLRMLAGFEHPSAGRIEIDGRDATHTPPERRPVNLVFQRYALFPHKNVLENVLYGLEAAGVPRREADARARDFLTLCRIEELAGRRVSELSGGQAQRVAVARALVKRPKVLLLDEPLAALDLKLRHHLQVELRRLQRELGMTFIYVTHDQGEALSMSDSIVLMNDGKVVQHSTPRQLYDLPASVFAARFIGEANTLPCVVRSSTPDATMVSIAGATLEVARPPSPDARIAGASATLCVRPENIELYDDPHEALLAGRIADVTFHGAVVRYWIELADGSTLIAEPRVRHGEHLHRIGESVGLSFNPTDAVILSE